MTDELHELLKEREIRKAFQYWWRHSDESYEDHEPIKEIDRRLKALDTLLKTLSTFLDFNPDEVVFDD